MANRYWVGGSGTWDSTNTANWSTTSGGPGGASVPTASDAVTINVDSGAGTVSVSGSVTCYNLYISVQTVDFGSSTVTVTGDFSAASSATIIAGTSTIQMSNSNFYFHGGGKTYNTVKTTNTYLFFAVFTESNTFNTLWFANKTVTNLSNVTFNDAQTISTLSFTNVTPYRARHLFKSNVLGTPVTLTVGAISGTPYVDFRDITIAGAAAPISGNFGDCLGNSGITFPAPKTVYYVGTSGDALGANAWATTSTGVGADANFPLAQDTIVVTDNYPAASSTLDFGSNNSNFGTFDFTGRTLALTVYGSVNLYGNVTNGSGADTANFGFFSYGRSTQTLTSAGKALYGFISYSFGGTIVFADDADLRYISLEYGNLTAVTANVTSAQFTIYGNNSKTVAFGSGTWTLGTNFFLAYPGTLTVTGTGTIRMASSSAITFNGYGIQTWPTLDQGGAGTLTVTGSNKFKGLTNSYGATGATTIKFTGGTTNEFDEVSLYGSAGKLCTLTSTNTTPITLKKGSAWRVGPNSVNGGNNTGLLFMAGNGDYLNVSYINAQPFAGGDMMLIFGF